MEAGLDGRVVEASALAFPGISWAGEWRRFQHTDFTNRKAGQSFIEGMMGLVRVFGFLQQNCSVVARVPRF